MKNVLLLLLFNSHELQVNKIQDTSCSLLTEKLLLLLPFNYIWLINVKIL